jgi:glyoxalase family protein
MRVSRSVNKKNGGIVNFPNRGILKPAIHLKNGTKMQLAGIHHLTAITANAKQNLAFFTQTLGMRLVKKTVNQDDVTAYHLFYADGKATPGSDVTFFDWPTPPERRGTRSIVRTSLRVSGEDTIFWWQRRFSELHVNASEPALRDGRLTLDFEDAEGQRLSLVEDGGAGPVNPWDRGPVPADYQIRGLGPIVISVPSLEKTDKVLTGVTEMRKAREYASAGDKPTHVYEMGAGGPAAELHVIAEPDQPVARQGAGGVHHVAFRCPTFEEYDAWVDRLRELQIPSSGPVDRFYFRSLYFREPGGVLFEIATDGPGFATDEPLETLGEKLSLPPFLEPHRKEIEGGLTPL